MMELNFKPFSKTALSISYKQKRQNIQLNIMWLVTSISRALTLNKLHCSLWYSRLQKHFHTCTLDLKNNLKQSKLINYTSNNAQDDFLRPPQST